MYPDDAPKDGVQFALHAARLAQITLSCENDIACGIEGEPH
jgi:hypothetical protein